MSSTDQKIRDAIKVECDRQHVGVDRQRMLYGAYLFLEEKSKTDYVLNPRIVESIAGMIEPSNGTKFRTTPVSFNGIVGGVHPNAIAACMENWIDVFNGEMAWETPALRWNSDGIIKEFLDIHPFSDGNGRTAWLLRVWLLNQWDDPQPLPDYFKEG